MKDYLIIDPALCAIARNLGSHLYDGGKYAVYAHTPRIMMVTGLICGRAIRMCVEHDSVRIYGGYGESHTPMGVALLHKVYRKVQDYLSSKTLGWSVLFNPFDLDMYIEQSK